jgi:anthranilate phosphoribosyltransferase
VPNALLTGAIDALASGTDLSEAQAGEVLSEIMHGEVSEIQIAGFLIALRAKGETVQELAGLARVAGSPRGADRPRRPARYGRDRGRT